MEMKGLENKLDNVHVGDIIKLHSPKLDVAGYVIDFNSRRVKLSHENPFSEIAPQESWDLSYRVKRFGPGDRFYNLEKFESFEVLEKYKSKEK